MNQKYIMVVKIFQRPKTSVQDKIWAFVSLQDHPGVHQDLQVQTTIATFWTFKGVTLMPRLPHVSQKEDIWQKRIQQRRSPVRQSLL